MVKKANSRKSPRVLDVNKVYQGNSLDVLKTFPDESLDMCITSPPYWGLRDYGTEGQIWDGDENCEHDFDKSKRKLHSGTNSEGGLPHHKNASIVDWEVEDKMCNKCGAWKGELGLEPVPEMFVNHLCDIFDEVKRVLRPHGSCWVNLGDTYNSSPAGNKHSNNYNRSNHKPGDDRWNASVKINKSVVNDLPIKSLVQIPNRFAIEMTNRGWVLRNELIWHKPSCLPAPIKDRYTVDFEKMFFFTKKSKYYFKQQFEPMVSKPHAPGNKFDEAKVSGPNDRGGKSQWDDTSRVWGAPTAKERRKKAKELLDKDIADGKVKLIAPKGRPQNPASEYEELLREYCQRMISSSEPNPSGRNKRTVWSINPASFKEAHFATYPPELIESPIDAGCPLYVCTKCGKPREVILEKSWANPVEKPNWKEQNKEDWKKIGKARMNKGEFPTGAIYKENGYTDCGCGEEFVPGVVLDPFFGSGTTAEVAMKQDKNWVGIELNDDYTKISDKRLKPTIVESKTRKKASEFWS